MTAGRLRSARAAVVRDLDELAERDAELARSADALLALKLSEIVDDETNSATSRTAAARELRETMRSLRERAPAPSADDWVDGLHARVNG